jgi:energy-coupling factor transporter ATP-binding protein EcfA2
VIATVVHALVLIAVCVALVLAGKVVVAMVHRRTLLGARNLYAALAVLVVLFAATVMLGDRSNLPWLAIALVVVGSMALDAGRRRSHALGAGGEIRQHELARRWVWQRRPRRAPGERVFLGPQDEVVHILPWSTDQAYVSMTDQGQRGPRLPLGAGQHVFLVGGTGSGKTTTARRLLAARVLHERSSLVVIDQKGDQEDVDQMRRLAAAAGVPFILFDPLDPDTDRWQPLWGTPSAVVARATEAIKASEPFYYDAMRKHLDVVCRVLHAADKWPPSIPYLVDCLDPGLYPTIVAMAEQLSAEHAALARRAARHARWVKSPRGMDGLSGAQLRVETAIALATSQVITPRQTPDGEVVGVSLVEALRRRSVVMWRTHADVMPDEAAALTSVALSDLHTAAACDIGQWTLMLDEFGAVISTAADRALGILQRGRSHGGQAIVITQSVADIEALTATPGLLDSLSDNFAAIVAHKQTSPDSRDWLSRLMGTRELSQHTDQTDGHGRRRSGRGSARRVHEFRVAPDVFPKLTRGNAIIYTPEGRQATQAAIKPVRLPDAPAERIALAGPTHPVEIAVHPEQILANTSRRVPAGGRDESDECDGYDTDDDAFGDI